MLFLHIRYNLMGLCVFTNKKDCDLDFHMLRIKGHVFEIIKKKHLHNNAREKVFF